MEDVHSSGIDKKRKRKGKPVCLAYSPYQTKVFSYVFGRPPFSRLQCVCVQEKEKLSPLQFDFTRHLLHSGAREC